MGEIKLQLRALAMVQQQLSETLDLAGPGTARTSNITPWVGLAGEEEQGQQRRPGSSHGDSGDQSHTGSDGSVPLEQLPAVLSTQLVQVRPPPCTAAAPAARAVPPGALCPRRLRGPCSALLQPRPLVPTPSSCMAAARSTCQGRPHPWQPLSPSRPPPPPPCR